MATESADRIRTNTVQLQMGEAVDAPIVSALFTQWPIIQDDLETDSSIKQDETVRTCLPYLSGQDEDVSVWNLHGVPPLAREHHIAFFHKSLGALPSRAVAVDAARPWYLYWCLAGLTLLDEDVSSYRERLITTARTMQNETGGFGGGGQQFSHLATTYATVLALAIVGGEEALDLVDRKQMWKWLCQLKQADGGFQVCVNGEEDIRYVSCAIVLL
jgi:protein farnesyltransferase subunit beta